MILNFSLLHCNELQFKMYKKLKKYANDNPVENMHYVVFKILLEKKLILSFRTVSANRIDNP